MIFPSAVSGSGAGVPMPKDPATAANWLARCGGNGAPDSCSERAMVHVVVTGISAGMIGVSQPAATTRSRSRK